MDVEHFCKLLPKIELHAHLNGSLSAGSLLQLGCLNENVLEYQKLTKLSKRTNKTLGECFELFKFAQNVTNTTKNVYLATKSILEEFANDNVVYLELRTTPRQEYSMNKTEYIEAVIQAIKECDKIILTKLLLSIDRRHDFVTSEESMKLFIAMKNKYPDIIKGVDFSGDPKSGIFTKNLFEMAVETGLFVTLHCAEVENENEIKHMLEFKPHRIGHATCIHPKYNGSQELWELYCRTKIPIECCLTSNVICGTSKSYSDHHLQEWIKNGLPFTLGTDDKGIFDTSLSEEMTYAAKHLKLSLQDLVDISLNSIDYSFASSKEKHKLKEMLNEWKLKYQL